jgi:hypothetical protein
MLLMGGAAMVLMDNARPSTRDVDVFILLPKKAQIVRELAKQVAHEYNLPEDWLNDGAKGYLVGVSQGAVIFSAPGIVAKSPATAQLLAMKLSAWRDDVDIEDARLLAVSASLLELFAARLGHLAPAWTKTIGPLPKPIFLLKAATTMKRLRELCEAESPEPLRKRGFYAPPNYLEFA